MTAALAYPLPMNELGTGYSHVAVPQSFWEEAGIYARQLQSFSVSYC